MWIWRRMERISWMEHRTNEEINGGRKKITDRNNQKPTEKLAGPHNERRLPSKNYNRGKNGREKEKRKTKNDVTGLDAERGLQQVEGESWGLWSMAPLDVRTCLGRQKTNKKIPVLLLHHHTSAIITHCNRSTTLSLRLDFPDFDLAPKRNEKLGYCVLDFLSYTS